MRIILFVWLFYHLSFCTPYLVLKNTKDGTFLVCIKVCYNYGVNYILRFCTKVIVIKKNKH